MASLYYHLKLQKDNELFLKRYCSFEFLLNLDWGDRLIAFLGFKY